MNYNCSISAESSQEGVVLTMHDHCFHARLVQMAIRLEWELSTCVCKAMFHVAQTTTCALSRRMTNAPRARWHCRQGRETSLAFR